MMKVLALILSLGMQTNDRILGLTSTGGSTFLSTERPLAGLESTFSLPVPARIINLLPRRESREALEAYIYADLALGEWVGAGWDFIARKDDVPLPSFALDAACLRCSFEGSMELNLDVSKLGEMKPLPIDLKRLILREREAVIAIA